VSPIFCSRLVCSDHLIGSLGNRFPRFRIRQNTPLTDLSPAGRLHRSVFNGKSPLTPLDTQKREPESFGPNSGPKASTTTESMLIKETSPYPFSISHNLKSPARNEKTPSSLAWRRVLTTLYFSTRSALESSPNEAHIKTFSLIKVERGWVGGKCCGGRT
jgi:hypothetical protein